MATNVPSPSPSSSSSSSTPVSRRRQAVTQLRAMFPDTDPGYLDAAILAYPDSFTTDKLIARVASKMLDMNYGHWPTVLLRDLKLGLGDASSSSQFSAWSSSKGKQRASSWDTIQASNSKYSASKTTSLLHVDETATMNAALIQLNEIFPTVDLSYLRKALTSSRHSYVYFALANLLADPTLSPEASSPWQITTASSRQGKRSRSTSNDDYFTPMPGGQVIKSGSSKSSASSSQRRHEPLPKRQNPGEMTSADLIKDARYTESAFKMICSQFPNVWKSSIRAVMAEHNNDYFTSVDGVKRLQEERPTNFFARTWSFITQAFGNKSAAGGSQSEASKASNFSIREYLAEGHVAAEMSPTLLYELHLHITATLSAKKDVKTKLSRRDSKASNGNVTRVQADADAQDIECGCCFTDISPQDAASCADGCLFCKQCLSRAVHESVFGQAPLRLHRDRGADDSILDVGGEGTGIRCLSIEGCRASFSDSELRRCLDKEVYTKLERALAQENLRLHQADIRKHSKGRPVRTVQCPFCSYVELEDVPSISRLWSSSKLGTGLSGFVQGICSVISVSTLYLIWMMAGILVPEILNIRSSRYKSENSHELSGSSGQDMPIYLGLEPLNGSREIVKRITKILDDTTMRSNGASFICRNTIRSSSQPHQTTFASPALIYNMLPPPPASGSLASDKLGMQGLETKQCGRPSCRLCGKLHYAGHECVDSLEGLRLATETAASNAVKRQCPDCGLSFLKDSGCNKVVCRCGYVMCFVCRKCIADERYAHFCQHPRDPPGSSCSICTKCDLFKLEDEARAVKKAVEQGTPQVDQGP